MDEKYKKFLEDLNIVTMSGDPSKIMEFMYANPEYTKYLQEQQKKREEGVKTAENVSTTLDILKNLGFTAAALGQIATSKRNEPTKPSLPSVPRRDPLLSQALYESKRGIFDPSTVISPAKQEIQDAYNNALVQSQAASGGQAGSYQAMAQAANTARMRAALGLAPIAQQAQLANQEIYNNLLGQRLGETQRMFENELGVSGAAMDQYNLESQVAGMAGAYGRENLYKALSGISDSLSNNPYYLPFDDGIKNYMSRVRRDNSANTQQAMSSSAFADPSQFYSGSFRPRMDNRFKSPYNENYS